MTLSSLVKKSFTNYSWISVRSLHIKELEERSQGLDRFHPCKAKADC